MEREDVEELKQTIKEGFESLSNTIKQKLEIITREIRELKSSLLFNPEIPITGELGNPKIETKVCKECEKEFETLDEQSLYLIRQIWRFPKSKLIYFDLCNECLKNHSDLPKDSLLNNLKNSLNNGEIPYQCKDYIEKCINLLGVTEKS
jgi:hypothetical protein